MMKRVLATSAIALAFSTAGNAATQVVTASFAPIQTNFIDQVLNLPKFDSSLGTLTGIAITLIGNINGTISFENRGTGSNTITGTSAATISLARPGGGVPIVVSLPTQSQTATLAAYDGVLDFAGTSGASFAVSTSQSQSATLSSVSDLTLFTGIGSLAALLSATSTSGFNSGGPFTGDIQTLAGADASITYTYDAITGSVPEPVTWAMLTGGFALVGGALRRQKVRVGFI